MIADRLTANVHRTARVLAIKASLWRAVEQALRGATPLASISAAAAAMASGANLAALLALSGLAAWMLLPGVFQRRKAVETAEGLVRGLGEKAGAVTEAS